MSDASTNYAALITNRVTMRDHIVAPNTPHERVERRGLYAHPNNSWPDQMVVINATLVPETAGCYYDLGRRVGSAQHRVYTSRRSMPDVVTALLSAQRNTPDTIYVSYFWVAPGNAGVSDPATWDVTAIVEPAVNPYGQGAVYTPGIIVRLAHHAHTMTERLLANCYREHSCSGCGLRYRIDSSD